MISLSKIQRKRLKTSFSSTVKKHKSLSNNWLPFETINEFDT